jgi:CRP-like cAMP-binding protein
MHALDGSQQFIPLIANHRSVLVTRQQLFLLFDGVLRVEVDGKPVAEVGPGAILGEMALLHQGRRMATLRAVTPCRVAVVSKDRIDRQALEQLAKGRMPNPER